MYIWSLFRQRPYTMHICICICRLISSYSCDLSVFENFLNNNSPNGKYVYELFLEDFCIIMLTIILIVLSIFKICDPRKNLCIRLNKSQVLLPAILLTIRSKIPFNCLSLYTHVYEKIFITLVGNKNGESTKIAGSN